MRNAKYRMKNFMLTVRRTLFKSFGGGLKPPPKLLAANALCAYLKSAADSAVSKKNRSTAPI